MAFHDGRTHCREDEVFWRKDGSSFPVEYTSTPIFENGKLTGAVVVFSDITDRIRRRNWDQARIDILKGVLCGRSMEDIINALCVAFAAFQPGCQIAMCRAPSAERFEAGDGSVKQTLTHSVTNDSGELIGTIHVERGSHLASHGLTSSLAEVALLFKAALTHSSSQ